MGNLQSVVNALSFLGESAIISDKAEDVNSARALVLPGVGAFGAAMKNLKELNLIDVLNKRVKEDKVPILGICLGMQLIATESTELGHFKGLNWISGRVERFETSANFRVPHVGWNQIQILKKEPFFENIEDGSDYYFVHSYHFKTDTQNIAATCDYGGAFTAAVQKENIFAVQFHPEKSQHSGLKLLRNFIKATRC